MGEKHNKRTQPKETTVLIYYRFLARKPTRFAGGMNGVLTLLDFKEGGPHNAADRDYQTT